MAGTPISALPDASIPLTGNELVPLVQAGVTSKARLASVGGGVGHDTYTPAPPALELVDWMPAQPSAGTWRVYLDGTSPFAVLYSIHPSLSVGGRRVRLMHGSANGLASISIAYEGQKAGFPNQGTPEGRLLPADSAAREIVRAFSSVDLEYDGTVQRWRVIRTRHIATVERSVLEHGGMPAAVDPTQLIVCDDTTGLKCEPYPNPGSPQVRLWIDPSAFPPPPPPPPPPLLALAVADDHGHTSDYSTTLTVHDSASVTATVGGTAGAPTLTLEAGGDATYTSIVVNNAVITNESVTNATVTNLNVTGASTIPLYLADLHGHSDSFAASVTFQGDHVSTITLTSDTFGGTPSDTITVNTRLWNGYTNIAGFALSLADGAWETTGLTLTLPYNGDYLLTYSLRGRLQPDAAPAYITARWFDVTQNVVVDQSEGCVVEADDTATVTTGSVCVVRLLLVTAAPEFIRVEVQRDGGGTYSVSEIASDTRGWSLGHAVFLGGPVPPPPPPPGTVLLRDAFVDVDGTALVDHVMDVGPGWTVASDSPPTMDAVIGVSPAAVAMTPQVLTNDVAVSDAGAADAVVSAPMSFTDPAGDGGLCFRYQDLSNFWLFQLSFGPQVAEVYKRVAGGFTLVASDTMTLTTGTTYTLTVRCVGDDVTATVSGGPTLTFTDADLDTATSWGFFFGAGGSGSPAYAYGFEVDAP